MVLKLDRMTIEEGGPNPARLAAAIHLQLQHNVGAVPIYEIATALDIIEIREASLKGLEGALVTTPDRNVGSIVLNRQARPPRRRFTLAHELGHFLNPWHRPSDPSGSFSCSRADMVVGWKRRSTSVSMHVSQEIEANRFAIELLAPPHLMRPYLGGIPDLAKVLSLAGALDLSREACARRYVEMLEQPSALIFSAMKGLFATSIVTTNFRLWLVSAVSARQRYRYPRTKQGSRLTRRQPNPTGSLGPAPALSSSRP